MVKIIVRYLIYFDRARRYISIAQTILVIIMFLKIFDLAKIWYYILVPIVVILALVVGYLDTKLGIREEETRNMNTQNPELKEILTILKTKI
jgi:predicted membrane protein